MKNLREYLNRLPSVVSEKAIRFYQNTFSPDHSMIFPGGSTWRCRFFPSCSQYASLAIRQYGLIDGGMLSLKRILKCNPLRPGGYDPVPK